MRQRNVTVLSSCGSTRNNAPRRIACVLIPLLSLLSSRDLAANDEPPATLVIKGEAAPFSGQLLTVERSIRLGQKAKYCQAQIKIELEQATSQAAHALAHERRLTEIEAERAERFKAELAQVAAEADSVWNSPALWLGGGVVGTLVLVLVTGHAMGEIRGRE